VEEIRKARKQLEKEFSLSKDAYLAHIYAQQKKSNQSSSLDLRKSPLHIKRPDHHEGHFSPAIGALAYQGPR